MPSTMDSCFPKMKRPQSKDSSFDEDEERAIPSFVRNFNSLYSTAPSSTKPSYAPSSPELQYGSVAYGASTPDLSALYTSRRFFISSPGQSNSIINSLTSSASSSSLESDTSVMKNSVAVLTHSPDPYADFRRSMEEMVEAREVDNETSSWEYLHELLLCYLALNPETIHKFIIQAFADLVVNHMSVTPSIKNGGRSRHLKSYRNIKSSRMK